MSILAGNCQHKHPSLALVTHFSDILFWFDQTRFDSPYQTEVSFGILFSLFTAIFHEETSQQTSAKRKQGKINKHQTLFSFLLYLLFICICIFLFLQSSLNFSSLHLDTSISIIIFTYTLLGFIFYVFCLVVWPLYLARHLFRLILFFSLFRSFNFLECCRLFP